MTFQCFFPQIWLLNYPPSQLASFFTEKIEHKRKQLLWIPVIASTSLHLSGPIYSAFPVGILDALLTPLSKASLPHMLGFPSTLSYSRASLQHNISCLTQLEIKDKDFIVLVYCVSPRLRTTLQRVNTQEILVEWIHFYHYLLSWLFALWY